MKQSAEVSNQLTSVDRLLKYSTLPEEKQPKGEYSQNILDFFCSVYLEWGYVIFEEIVPSALLND